MQARVRSWLAAGLAVGLLALAGPAAWLEAAQRAGAAPNPLAAGPTPPAAPVAPAGPVLTNAPTVLGIAAAGKQLTGLSGTWAGSGVIDYRFQWYRCDAAGAECHAVRGSTSPLYALVARDVGKTIGLAVGASDPSGTTTAYASIVGPIAQARSLLESTAQPTVSGPPVEGKSITVSTGAWSPTPAKVTYAWERCNANGRVCAAIPGATANSYRLTAADIGHALVVLVQATYGPTSQNAFSTATPAAVDASVAGPVPITLPAVGGPPVEHAQLTAGVGVWKSIGSITFAFQWRRCDTTGSHCASIHGATRSTYTLVAKDTGATTALTVRATDSTGDSVAYASLYGPIAPASASLVATAQPAIAGTAKRGQRLTVSTGAWTSSPESYAFSWLRCNRNGRLCAAIAGATSASYVPVRADVGHTLIADVQASAGGEIQAAFSPATARVGS